LSTLITEFKKYNVTPEDLEKVSKELEEDNPVKEKLMELTAIYDLFEKTIAERYRDPDDDLTLAAKKLGSIPFTTVPKSGLTVLPGLLPRISNNRPTYEKSSKG